MKSINLLTATLLAFASLSVGPVLADPAVQIQIAPHTTDNHDRERCEHGRHYSQSAHHCVRDREQHRDDQHEQIKIEH